MQAQAWRLHKRGDRLQQLLVSDSKDLRADVEGVDGEGAPDPAFSIAYNSQKRLHGDTVDGGTMNIAILYGMHCTCIIPSLLRWVEIYGKHPERGPG